MLSDTDEGLAVTGSIWKSGTVPSKSSVALMARFSSIVLVNAVTATGVFCRDSSRFCAVTMISSTPSLESAV